MTLDQRLAQAVRHVADGVVVPAVDPDAVRARARSSRRRRAAVVAVAAVMAVVVAGATVVSGRDSSSPLRPAGPGSPSISESPSTDPLPSVETGPKSWTPYTSTRYRFAIGHPPDRGAGGP